MYIIRRVSVQISTDTARIASSLSHGMEQVRGMTPAKRKRLLKTLGGCSGGYINEDLERFLNLLYGLFSDV